MKKAHFRKPYRIKKKKSILKNRFFLFGILVLFVFTWIFYFFVFAKTFQLEKIIINGQNKVSEQEIKIIVEQGIGEKLLFWEIKSIFLVNLDKIRENILNNFPQIDNVEIKKGFPDTLNLKVMERKEIGIFCANEKCFLLDEKGIIFADVLQQQELIKIQNSAIDRELKLGEQAVDKELLSKILQVVVKLKKDLKISLDEVLIINKQRLNIKTSENWEIYLNPEQDINWQLLKLSSVLEEEIPLEKRKDLEYIDLRFGNYSPYKYRD